MRDTIEGAVPDTELERLVKDAILIAREANRRLYRILIQGGKSEKPTV